MNIIAREGLAARHRVIIRDETKQRGEPNRTVSIGVYNTQITMQDLFMLVKKHLQTIEED